MYLGIGFLHSEKAIIVPHAKALYFTQKDGVIQVPVEVELSKRHGLFDIRCLKSKSAQASKVRPTRSISRENMRETTQQLQPLKSREAPSSKRNEDVASSSGGGCYGPRNHDSPKSPWCVLMGEKPRPRPCRRCAYDIDRP